MWGSTRYGASAPPADPLRSVFHIPPHPPPQPSFEVCWRGMGWQGRPTTPGGVRVSRPLPIKNNSDDGKGAMVPWTMRPIYLLLLMHAQVHASKQGRAAKPRRRSRTEGQGVKAKRFLGCGCRQGIPTSNTPPQPQTKTLNPSTSAKCLSTS